MRSPLLWTLLLLALAGNLLWQIDRRRLDAGAAQLAEALAAFPDPIALPALRHTLVIDSHGDTAPCPQLIWAPERWLQIQTSGGTELRPSSTAGNLRWQLHKAANGHPHCRHWQFTLHGRWTPQTRQQAITRALPTQLHDKDTP